MNEEEIKEMKKEARKVLNEIKNSTDEKLNKWKKNAFKIKWWGITPESALELYPTIK